MAIANGLENTWPGVSTSEAIGPPEKEEPTTPSANFRTGDEESPNRKALHRSSPRKGLSSACGTSRQVSSSRVLSNNQPWSCTARACGPTNTESATPLYYCYSRTVTTDPAARYVPLRGKLGFTQGLTVACLILMVCSCIVGRGITSLKENPMLGPDVNSLLLMGALKSSLVRSGEWWRLFWAVYLHAGWFHLIMNFILWYRLGVMVEPDWGFLRTLFVFQISAVTGNMLSATLDPYNVSVGASGGIFGVMGGCIPYIMEYWHTIPKPKCILYIVIGSLLLGIACGFMPYIDNYAHMGGAASGVLLGFVTITNIEMGRSPIRKRPVPSGAISSKYAVLRQWLGLCGKSVASKTSAVAGSRSLGSGYPRNGVEVEAPGAFQKSSKFEVVQGDGSQTAVSEGSREVQGQLPILKIARESNPTPFHAVEGYNAGLEAAQAGVSADDTVFEPRVTSSNRNTAEGGTWSRTASYTPAGNIGADIIEDTNSSKLHVSLENSCERPARENGSQARLELIEKDHSLANPLSPLAERRQQPTTPQLHGTTKSTNSPSTWRMEALEFARANQMGMVYRPRSEGVPRRKIPSRVTIRSTYKENVTDAFVWDDALVWAVRISAALVLIAGWATMYYYLFVCAECYTAPGQLVKVPGSGPAIARNDGRMLIQEPSSDGEAEAFQASLEWIDQLVVVEATNLLALGEGRTSLPPSQVDSVVTIRPELEESLDPPPGCEAEISCGPTDVSTYGKNGVRGGSEGPRSRDPDFHESPDKRYGGSVYSNHDLEHSGSTSGGSMVFSAGSSDSQWLDLDAASEFDHAITTNLRSVDSAAAAAH